MKYGSIPQSLTRISQTVLNPRFVGELSDFIPHEDVVFRISRVVR